MVSPSLSGGTPGGMGSGSIKTMNFFNVCICACITYKHTYIIYHTTIYIYIYIYTYIHKYGAMKLARAWDPGRF